MHLEECCTFLERFTGETFEKLYYVARNESLENDLRVIDNEFDYVIFMDATYQATKMPIDLYLDHIGMDLRTGWKKKVMKVVQQSKGMTKNLHKSIPPILNVTSKKS